jgi:hypothetical protein
MLDHDEEFLESDAWVDCVHHVRKEACSHLVAVVSSEPDGLEGAVQHVPYPYLLRTWGRHGVGIVRGRPRA